MDQLDVGYILGTWTYGAEEQQWESKRYGVRVGGMVWLTPGEEAADPALPGVSGSSPPLPTLSLSRGPITSRSWGPNGSPAASLDLGALLVVKTDVGNTEGWVLRFECSNGLSMEIRMSGGLGGTGQSLYSLAALSLWFSYVSSEPGEASWLPLHLVTGWIFLLEKLRGETGGSSWLCLLCISSLA